MNIWRNGLFAVVTIKEPFIQPFERIPNAYKIIMEYLQSNNFREKQQDNIVSCFEHEYEEDGTIYMDEVIHVMQNDKGTGKKDIEKALNYYGIKQSKTMIKADNSSVLPKACILKVFLPKYGHWILYYDGMYYDPEFGLMDALYHKARIQSYLEIYLNED